MTLLKKFLSIFLVAILQIAMTQIVTFAFSFLFPGGGEFFQGRPWFFALFLGLTFALGVFLMGWQAIRLGWLKMPPENKRRLIGSLVGSYLPLLAAVAIQGTLEAGSPFFMVSILASIAGFHLAGGIK